ncbi:hypothetical protein GOP47_0018561 [Adiantum capillus-veneris]|uniref:Thioredoxin domain-containing protein n=1 Tax=Adiantum capillus-veneris TaxID=13818 RepID=A0A9D4UE07_ADICA|nr:hypothetical protein GOP47_0018561 [Adiantum capillus-veneris]
MAAANGSNAPASDYAALSRASPKLTCKTLATLSTSFTGPSLKSIAPLKTTAQRRHLPVALATKHYRVTKISGAEFTKLLADEREKPMVVDFYAAWCGPCVILAQELEKLAVEFGHEVNFLKIDTDDEYALAHRLQVRGLPTVFFIRKDPQKNVICTEGILPKEVYRSIITNDLLWKVANDRYRTKHTHVQNGCISTSFKVESPYEDVKLTEASRDFKDDVPLLLVREAA